MFPYVLALLDFSLFSPRDVQQPGKFSVLNIDVDLQYDFLS